MTKRTNTTRTTIYRRHAGRCHIADQPLNTANCECMLWLHGKVRGKLVRVSLNTRSLATAEMRQRDIENGRDDDPTPTPDGGGPKLVKPTAGTETLEYAAAEFLKTSTGLSSSTRVVYTRAINHFCEWAAQQGLLLLRDIDGSHIHQYFAVARDWKRNTAQTRLVILRVFFNWTCKTRRWILFTPTQDRRLTQNGKRKGGSSSTRTPFTPAEVTMLLAAVERMPAADRDRARAIVYLLLFTGMRISDATFCERAYLTDDDNMDYFAIKTRKQIDLPPGVSVELKEALAKLPASRTYFLQPDVDGDYAVARTALRNHEGEFSLLMPGYTAKVRETTALVKKVISLAGLTGACHRFRDTFAVSLLVGNATKQTDIFTVSQMLGHSDVKITQDHYLKFIPGYRERMSKATSVLSYVFPPAVAA